MTGSMSDVAVPPAASYRDDRPPSAAEDVFLESFFKFQVRAPVTKRRCLNGALFFMLVVVFHVRVYGSALASTW